MSNTPVLSRWTYTLVDATGQEYFFDEVKVVSQAALSATRQQLLTAFNRKMTGDLVFLSQTFDNVWTDIIDFQAREVIDSDKEFVKKTLRKTA